MSAIPSSVLKLLTNKWDPARCSNVFESIFNGPNYSNRKKDPSYYHIHVGKKVETDMDTFSYEEAAALVKDAVFENLARVGQHSVVINEHAQHALVDFLGDTYRAWEKYQNRIGEVQKIGVFPELG